MGKGTNISATIISPAPLNYTIAIPKGSDLLLISEQVYGTIKKVGMLYTEAILYGDVNLLKQGLLFYIDSVKQVYRYIRTKIEEGLMYYCFDTIKPFTEIKTELHGTIKTVVPKDMADGFIIPEDQLGWVERAGHLFNKIIYTGDLNMIDGGMLYYNNSYPFISLTGFDSDTELITISTKYIDENNDINTIISEYRGGTVNEYTFGYKIITTPDDTIYDIPDTTVQIPITVTNTGEQYLNDAAITFNFPDGTVDSIPIGNIMPGESKSTQIAYIVTSEDIENKFTNIHVDFYGYTLSGKVINDTNVCVVRLMHVPYDELYLTFTMLEDGQITFKLGASGNLDYIAYSVDNGDTWVSTSPQRYDTVYVQTPTLKAGEAVMWKGEGMYVSQSAQEGPGSSCFTYVPDSNVSGNILSLLYGDDFANETTLPEISGGFSGLFYDAGTNINIINAKDLILADISNASSNTYGYAFMFENNKLLESLPQFRITMASQGMCSNMFKGCVNLKNIPNDCLSTITTCGDYCYLNMFYGCTSLLNAPELPATTLGVHCYSYMFHNCANLITASKISATTLTNYCYEYMFLNCTSLINVPADMLPSTSLTTYCYYAMFKGCTSLIEAPELPALTLQKLCYYEMFSGCSSLNYIKASFTTTPGTSSSTKQTYNWVYGVASTGTFIKNPDATWTTTGANGVPYSWTTKEWEDDLNYFTTEAVEDCAFSFAIGNINTLSSAKTIKYVEYSIDDGATWTKRTNVYNTTITTPTISAGDKVKWRCASNGFSNGSSNSTFSSTGQYNVSGDISTLTSCNYPLGQYVYMDLFLESSNLISAEGLLLGLPSGSLCFAGMFLNCTSLVETPRLSVNTTTYGCCYLMFQGCTSLVDGSNMLLNATSANNSCYQNMFSDCTSLTTIPELPATTLARECYSSMFYGCTSLTSAPTLPATTLADGCYAYMFQNCTSLTTAPELPAITLVYSCYFGTFNGCTNLNYIKALFTTEPGTSYTRDWVTGVAATGTFVKSSDAAWTTTGVHGVPTGWTVETASS